MTATRTSDWDLISCDRDGCGWQLFVRQDVTVDQAAAAVVALGGQATVSSGVLRSHCHAHAESSTATSGVDWSKPRDPCAACGADFRQDGWRVCLDTCSLNVNSTPGRQWAAAYEVRR